MNKKEFEELLRANDGRCLWHRDDVHPNFDLEMWIIKGGRLFIRQIWKKGHGEDHFIQTPHTWEQTAKALGMVEDVVVENT